MREIPAAMRQLMEITPAAQMLFDGTVLAAISPEGLRLFPEAVPGSEAGSLFGDAADVLINFSGKGAILFTVSREKLHWDVTASDWEGFTLCTVYPIENARDLSTLEAVGRTLMRQMTVQTAMFPRLMRKYPRDHGAMDARAAEMNRSIYALMRLSSNLQLTLDGHSGLFVQPVPTELDLWLEGLVREAAGPCKEVGISLTFRCAPDNYHCQVDRDLLNGAMMNLISNAVKFSKSGDQVEVSLRRSGDRGRITVQDQGCGIPADRLGQIFRPTGLQQSVPDPRQGVGLGMPIVRNVILAHGGSMLLESEPGQGTKVHLTLGLESRAMMTLRSPVKVPTVRGGINPMLIGLADILPASLFDPHWD